MAHVAVGVLKQTSALRPKPEGDHIPSFLHRTEYDAI